MSETEAWTIVGLHIWSWSRYLMPLILGLANCLSIIERRTFEGKHGQTWNYELSLGVTILWFASIIGTYLAIAGVWT